jgi:hypothetical protein
LQRHPLNAAAVVVKALRDSADEDSCAESPVIDDSGHVR